MKKLTKIFGLMLIAGALVMGCKKDAGSDSTADIETTEITLSNGTWESNQKINGEVTSGGMSSTIDIKDKTTFEVSGENITIKSSWTSMTTTTTYPDSMSDEDIAQMKSIYDMMASIMTLGGKTAESKQEGKKLTFSMSGDASAREIEEMNAEMETTTEYKSQIPSTAKILTNEKKTVYKITWTGDYEEDMTGGGSSYPSCNYEMTLKKK